MRKALIAAGVSAIGLSALLMGLGALVGLSESHAGTRTMIEHAQIQALVAGSAFLWSVFVAIRRRSARLTADVFAVLLAGQVSLYVLSPDGAPVREWTGSAALLAGLALLSVPGGWWLSIASVQQREHT